MPSGAELAAERYGGASHLADVFALDLFRRQCGLRRGQRLLKLAQPSGLRCHGVARFQLDKPGGLPGDLGHLCRTAPPLCVSWNGTATPSRKGTGTMVRHEPISLRELRHSRRYCASRWRRCSSSCSRCISSSSSSCTTSASCVASVQVVALAMSGVLCVERIEQWLTTHSRQPLRPP